MRAEWTILEKLLLTQAVHKYGENMWFQVARVLKQNDLLQQQSLQRSSDFYSQKNCSHQYYLLVEYLEAEKQASLDDLLNDIPVVVRLAKNLYSERVKEIKDNLKKQQEEFAQLAIEINSIRSGNWKEVDKTTNSFKRTASSESLNPALMKKQKRESQEEEEEPEKQVNSTSIHERQDLKKLMAPSQK